MAAPKTTRTDADVHAFIDGVANATRRADAQQLVELMQDVTGEPPAMWGPTIIGFGSCRSGSGAAWMRIGFSPRAAKTSIYVLTKPERWDDPQALAALIDAVRWGTVASADVSTLQAPFRSGIPGRIGSSLTSRNSTVSG